MGNDAVKSVHFRLDPLVLNSFVCFILAGVILLIVRYSISEAPPVVGFSVGREDYSVNEVVRFRNETTGGDRFSWDFGDGQKGSFEKSPVHIYKKPGIYEVKLTVDNTWSHLIKLRIKDLKREQPREFTPRISGPDMVMLGEPVTFTCGNDGAKTFEWKMGESGTVDGYERSVTYAYAETGYKTVQLVINGSRKYTATMQVYVRMETDKPTEKPKPTDEQVKTEALAIETRKKENEEKKKAAEPPKLAPVVKILPEDKLLCDMLLKVAKGDGNKAEFESYLVGSASDPIINRNGKMVSLETLLKELKDQEIVLKEFTTTRQGNSAILNITMRYRVKRSFF